MRNSTSKTWSVRGKQKDQRMRGEMTMEKRFALQRNFGMLCNMECKVLKTKRMHCHHQDQHQNPAGGC
jgi:hypothetical protein